MTNIDFFQKKNLQLVRGYAETKFVKSYVFYPKDFDECSRILKDSLKKGLQICCRGSGLSYADIITHSDNVILDLTLMNKILSWNNKTGIMTVQPGTTFGQIFNLSLLSNWALLSCPGSMDITIGGAVSNNVHGKDSYKNGNFGKQILELKIILASGEIITANLMENSDLFNNVIGGMGLLGVVIETKIQLKKIPSPFVAVNNKISKNIFDSIDYIEKIKNDYDFSVSWVDSFSRNNSIGRGFITSANWIETKSKTNEKEIKKTLIKSNKVFGILPSRATWYLARPFFRPNIIKQLNSLNFQYHRINNLFNQSNNNELLFTKYNFMHNLIPDIKNVFRPKGFIEIHPLLPLHNIDKNLNDLILLCQKFHCESLLCGLKAHSPDSYPLSFQQDGYSIGITIQLNGRKKRRY